jgi:hypothetical protein
MIYEAPAIIRKLPEFVLWIVDSLAGRIMNETSKVDFVVIVNS